MPISRAVLAARSGQAPGMCTSCGIRQKEPGRAHCLKCSTTFKRSYEKNGKQYNYNKRYVTGSLREQGWRQQGIVGLTFKQFQEQATHCRICGSTEKLVPDHDHDTHQFRGVLCSRCNTGLGFFRDNPQYLRCAEMYLGGQPCH